jgi:phage terminase small subunit
MAKTKEAAKKTDKTKNEAETPDVELDGIQEDLADQLTRLQRRFVLFLVGSDKSQRQAYYAAGGTAKNERAADAIAARMLANARVRAFYDSLMAQAQTDAVMSKEEALKLLTKKAKIKITDILDFRQVPMIGPDGEEILQTVWTIKDAENIDPEVAACIKSVKVTRNGPELEMYDSNQTIKLMADMLGWNAPKGIDHTSSDGSMTPVKSFNDMYDEE